MSSVDGARSTQGTSDEIIIRHCGPCNYEGTEVEAEMFCDDCNELLCWKCADYHKKYKQFRNHTTVPVAQAPKDEATGYTPSIVICDCNQNLEVTEYCEDHCDVVCQTCASTKHQNCKTQAISQRFVDEKAKIDSVRQKVDAMKKNIEMCLQEHNADLQKLLSVKETCTKEIQSFRQTLNQHLDLLEQNVLKEMEKLESREKKEIERHISSCSATQSMLQTDIQLLENAKKSSLSEYKFVAHTKVSVHLEAYGRLLREIRHETETPSIKFERNKQLADLQKTISKLGTLTTGDSRGDKSGESFPKLNVQTSSQVDIESPEDCYFNTPEISGCDIMQDGSIIVCDNTNKKVKHLDSSFTLKRCLSFQTQPWDVSVVNEKQVIITLPDKKQLQYMDVLPKLMTRSRIEIDKTCWGVHVAGNEIYITAHDGIFSNDTGEVRVFNLNGKMIRRIAMNQDGSYMFDRPYYLTVSPSSRNIYVSDYRSSKVWCLNSDGGVMYQYKNKYLKGPKAVCVDAEDNLLVCGHDSHNVQIVTFAGRKHSTLLTAKDSLQKPLSVAYRHSDSTCIVGCLNSNKLFVYKLS